MNDTIEPKKIIETFNSVSLEIIAQMTQCKVEAGRSYEREQAYKPNEYSVVIGVAGGCEGVVAMSMKEETALHIASSMMGNIPVTEFDAMAQSAIGELANVIVGRAFSQLAGEEAMSITPPTFIKGSDVSLSVGEAKKAYVVTLNTDKGDIEFIISLFMK